MGLNSVKHALLEVAQVREDVVDVGGTKIYVKEVGALEFADYGKMLKTDRVKATAALIAGCVLDGPGGAPAMTAEEAEPIARSARVSMPIVQKIMELSGFGDDEKESDAS